MWKDFNPWWEKDWEIRDKHIREWENQKIKWIPSWIDKISLEPFSLNFVIGFKTGRKNNRNKTLDKKIDRRW